MCHWIYVLIARQHEVLVMVLTLDDSLFRLFPNPDCLWSYNVIIGLRYKGNWESTQVETILSWISFWPSTCVFVITEWFFTHWLVKSHMVDKSLSMEMIWWWGSLLLSFSCTWFSRNFNGNWCHNTVLLQKKNQINNNFPWSVLLWTAEMLPKFSKLSFETPYLWLMVPLVVNLLNSP